MKYKNNKNLDHLANPHGLIKSTAICCYTLQQGSGNFEIWIGPADDDDIINEPISKKKKYVYITCHEN